MRRHQTLFVQSKHRARQIASFRERGWRSGISNRVDTDIYGADKPDTRQSDLTRLKKMVAAILPLALRLRPERCDELHASPAVQHHHWNT
jgi:hypothetical protein